MAKTWTYELRHHFNDARENHLRGTRSLSRLHPQQPLWVEHRRMLILEVDVAIVEFSQFWGSGLTTGTLVPCFGTHGFVRCPEFHHRGFYPLSGIGYIVELLCSRHRRGEWIPTHISRR